MISAFDDTTHTFTCENAQCGHRFNEFLRSLLHMEKVVCPECGTTKDIRESKRTGPVGLDFNTATEIDKQRSQKE